MEVGQGEVKEGVGGSVSGGGIGSEGITNSEWYWWCCNGDRVIGKETTINLFYCRFLFSVLPSDSFRII